MRPLYRAVNTLVLLAGLALLVVGIFPLYRSLESDNWPFVQGEITSATLEQPHSPLERGRDSGWGWHVNILYRYQVEGHAPMVGNRLEFGLGSRRYFLQEFAQRVVERYPPGKVVRVYINPARPQETVLERTPSMGVSLFWIVGGLIMVGLGLFGRFRDRWD